MDAKKTDAFTPDDRAAERERIMGIYRSPSKLTAAPAAPRGPLSQEDRIAGLILEAQKRAPPQLAQFLQRAGPVLVPFINGAIVVFNFVGPICFAIAQAIHTIIIWLPWDLLQATIGLCLCFFGGGYCASIAACEAFLMTGWPVTKRHLTEVYESAKAIVEAQKADEKRDSNNDGIADVQLMSASELVDHKLRITAAAVKEPQKLAAAIGGLYTGWLSVQGVLRIKFAKTVNLAMACSQFIEYYVTKFLLPMLTPFVAAEFVHWLPTCLSTMTRGFFVWFAWKMQEVVSAAQSGMRGGLMFSRGLLNWLNKRGVRRIGPLSLKHDETYFDEIVGYTVALFGFWVQWNHGFGVPFPLNLVMLPFDVLEWYIRVSITNGGSPAGAA